RPATVIEPTCGKGAFVIAASKAFKNAKILGFEINPDYVAEANASLAALSLDSPPTVHVADFFKNDWQTIISGSKEPILILGNPPWVTSSELGMLSSSNTPTKSNFQNRKGIEAITGAGNFDISEWMLLKHLNWLSHRSGSIAYLCKLSVARKVMLQAEKISAHRFSG